MKQLSLTIIFLLLINCAQSQSVKNNEYIGTLRLTNKELITYKINFTETQGGKLEGISITDIYGKNRTQSVIKGNVNGNDKISFYETVNVSSKSTTAKDEFCYVHVSDARLKTVNGKTLLQGSFVGKYPDGKNCAKGSLYMMSTTSIQELGKEFLTPEIIKNEDSLKLIKEKMNALLSESDDTYLRRNDIISLQSISTEITLDVWDGGGEEDNDEIAIFVNNKKIGETIVIKRERKIISIPLDSNSNQIKIIAINEGKWKSCTANILVKDGVKQTPIITVLRKGESAIIDVKRQK